PCKRLRSLNFNMAPLACPERRRLATVTNGDTLTEVGMERSGGGTKRGDPRSRDASQRRPSRDTGHDPSVIAARRHKTQDPVWQLGLSLQLDKELLWRVIVL